MPFVNSGADHGIDVRGMPAGKLSTEVVVVKTDRAVFILEDTHAIDLQ